MAKKPAVFLDRDGVIIEEVDYLRRLDQVRLIPGAAEAVRRLNLAQVPVVVVTNQSGVARGYFSEDQVQKVHDHLNRMLAGKGARIDRFYYCPHHPLEGLDRFRLPCSCRKPKPGMLLRASQDLDLHLPSCWMIGDTASDLEAGASAGCRTILVRTGHGDREAATMTAKPCQLVDIVTALPDGVDLFFRLGHNAAAKEAT